MRFGLPTALLVTLLAAPALGAQPGRQMAITFDDLPAQRAPHLPEERIVAITDGLLATLTAREVPAIGFVNEDKLERDGELLPSRVALLERWLDAGLELGNHSYSHPDLHRVELAAFESDVLRGERLTRPLAAARGLPYRFFRHPFLHTGRDLATRDAFLRFLADHGYRVAPVTIDNSEWIFARAFDAALDGANEALGERLAAAYVDYMEAMTAFYEDQSRRFFGREIPQVLLLHANALNARHLDALLERLGARGYSYVGLERALADPVFASPDTYVGPSGLTWIQRWATSSGVPGSAFEGEPRTPVWVQEVAGIEE